MQHLGTEDELKKVLREILATMSPEERLETLSEDERRHVSRDILATMSPEERLRGLPPEERLKGLPPAERLVGLSEEERLEGLTAEQMEHLRQLLEKRRHVNGNPAPPNMS